MPKTKEMLVGVAVLAAIGAGTAPGRAQCVLDWADGFAGPGMDSAVGALTVFDDGSGPALYAGGAFTTAGGVSANYIAKWDGSSWSALGSGMNVTNDTGVCALTVFDDGSGPALYAGGRFTTAGGVSANHIAKWDGSSWSALGSGMGGGYTGVYALTVFDDGSGPALYAGGSFTTAGGVACNRIARWDGVQWQPLGTGMNDAVLALSVYNGEMIAGGWFGSAGGVSARHIAKWDGSSWSPLGSGMDSDVEALSVFDDGSGPALYAGGDFTTAGGVSANHIAKWDGSSWSALGSGMDGGFAGVWTLAVFDDGSGPSLYAGGRFSTAGGVSANHTAKWDGSAWSALGSGMAGGVYTQVFALTVFDDGSGPVLYAGGEFTTAGAIRARYIAKWDGSSWSAVGSGMNGSVRALTVFDDGSGAALYAGGGFTTAGTISANYVARWDGSSWSALGSGMNGSVLALTVFDDGSGPARYAAGHFTTAGGVGANYIAKWDGSNWSALGSGIGGGSPYVFALTVFDDGSGPGLYAGGEFTTAGGVSANYVAKWDGSSWSALGSGMGGDYPRVCALTVFDDGSGPALYAGGHFATAGAVSANYVAKWDGSNWSALGSGIGGGSPYVFALTVFDDGSGPALYAGGQFTTAGGVSANYIAKWDGSTWSPLGSGMNNYVRALTVFDDGSGPALYAGGYFPAAGGVVVGKIAKWDGLTWSPLGSGMGGMYTCVYGLTVFDEGSWLGPALYAGGSFTTAGGKPSGSIAKWGCVLVLGDLNCDGELNAFDIDPFVLAVVDVPEYYRQYPDCDHMHGDIDGDGDVDAFDIDPFVELLTGG